MIVVEARPDDVEAWLGLVDEVTPLFGPAPGFEEVLRRKIAAGDALCARRDHDAPLCGGILLGGRAPVFWIRWLAVHADARRAGAGAALLGAALARFGGAEAVLVDTFRADAAAGRPARRLYARFGFTPGALIESDGAPRQRFERR